MEKITKNLIQQMQNIKEPFNTYDNVYLYLKSHNMIDFSHEYFRNIMAIYKYKAKKLYKTRNPPEVLNGKLSKIENAFCEEVYNLKEQTIYSVYKALYEQSLEDSEIALKFLKLYDRKEKKYGEMIKSKHKTKDTSKDDDIANNKNVIEKNMKEIRFLIENAQESNKINIADNTENNS